MVGVLRPDLLAEPLSAAQSVPLLLARKVDRAIIQVTAAVVIAVINALLVFGSQVNAR